MVGKTFKTAAWLIFLCALSCPPCGAQEKEKREDDTPRTDPTVVRGRVVDEADQPIADAVVSDLWASHPIFGMTPVNAAKCDVEGRFEIEGGFMTFFARDPTGKRGGVAKAPTDKSELRIVLHPLVTVSGKLDLSQVLGTVSFDSEFGVSLNVKLGEESSPLFLANIKSKSPTFSIRLPPGRFYFLLISHGTTDHGITVEIPEEAESLDLGTIELEPDTGGPYELLDKPIPAWTVTEVRGLPSDVKPKDLRGKWVLIEFWADWCGPCISGSLPQLIEFHENHADQQDRFQIITIHHQSTKTFEELDPKLVDICNRYWGGKDLPFPILLDSTGETQKRYLEINKSSAALPTAILIDPEGMVVAVHTGYSTTPGPKDPIRVLERKLAEEPQDIKP